MLSRTRSVFLAAAVMFSTAVFAEPPEIPLESLKKAVVSLEDRSIVYRGLLTLDAVSEVEKLLAVKTGIQQLVIESGGGTIDAGIDLGELVRRHGLDVRVTGDMCMSSCANYVFVAGNRKLIDPGATVVWHGSAIQKGLGDKIDISGAQEQLGRNPTRFEMWRLRNAARSYMRRIKSRQKDFYRKLAIDERLTIFGQDVGCECNWTIPVSDMVRFGVLNVHASETYGMPAPDWVEKNWRLLSLDDYPAYERSLRK